MSMRFKPDRSLKPPALAAKEPAMAHRTADQLAAGLDHVRASPRDVGRLEAIVIRPATGQRHDLDSCRLDPIQGAAGDRWVNRFPSPPLPGMEEQDTQLTLMNSRAVALVAGTRDRWPLAGDQLFVDLDLSEDHLRCGDRLRIGDEVRVEITSKPHNACRRFSERYGEIAAAFVNSAEGRRLHLRGVCARVVTPGLVRVGDPVRREVSVPST